jgi:hypothetical protein
VVGICFNIFAFGGRIVGYAGEVGFGTFFSFLVALAVGNFSWGRIGRQVHGVHGDLLFKFLYDILNWVQGFHFTLKYYCPCSGRS